MNTNRRNLLAGTAAATLLVGVGLIDGRSALAQPVKARASAHTPDGEQALIDYRNAVAVMKARPALDPTSWTYQALIHGVISEDPRNEFLQAVFGSVPPADPQRQLAEACWATCPHSSLSFVAWHRLYLYFFERIVRAASGVNDFALPYWNYSHSAQTAVLPKSLREPIAGFPINNSLFSQARAPEINGILAPARPLEASDVVLTALREPFFEATDNRDGFSASLESRPHNVIHGAIGGGDRIGSPLGDMSSTATAARDPVFWIHHCNIDRLWESWLSEAGETAANYADRDWYTRRWTFVDETGSRQDVSLKDLESELIGGPIVYDRLETVERDQIPAIAVADSFLKLPSSTNKSITLTPDGNVVEFQLPLTASAVEISSARVVLSGVSSNASLAVTFDVYLNLSNTSAAADEEPVGVFNFFGARHMSGPVSKRYIFDITRQVKEAVANGTWSAQPSITIIPRGPLGVRSATVETVEFVIE